MTTQAFAVKDIKSNPFRDLHLYPLNQEKIGVLRESILTTGFWDNLVARINAKGKPELAYGHHRLEAVKQECGADHIINLIVRDINDTQMLQMMARENMEEWGTSFPVVIDTIRVAVVALAGGRVAFEEVPNKTRNSYIREAPSFLPDGVCVGGSPTHSYTAQTLGAFLGWLDKDGTASKRLLNGLNALELLELDCMQTSNFDNLGKEEGYALTTQTKKTYARYVAKAKDADKEAKQAKKDGNLSIEARQKKQAAKARADGVKAAQVVADTISDELQTGTLDKSIPARAMELDKPHKNTAPPDINRVIRDLAGSVNKVLAEDDKKLEKFEGLARFFGEADFIEARGLHKALLSLSARAAGMASAIKLEEHKDYEETRKKANNPRVRDGGSLRVIQGG